jgi:hypothetical protein
MASNRRYEDHYDRMTKQRVLEAAVRPEPVSLTPAELDEANHPIRRGPAVPVRVWVRFQEQPVVTDAFAVEWNDRAVHIEWSLAGGTKLARGCKRTLCEVCNDLDEERWKCLEVFRSHRCY